MENTYKLPVYVRATFLIVGIFFLVSMLYIGQSILLPLIYAIIVSILLGPAVNFLVSKKINRAIAITIVLFVAVLLMSGIVAFIISQASLLRHAWPQLTNKFQGLVEQGVLWCSSCFHISAEKIYQSMAEEKTELIKNSGAAIGVTLTTMGGILAAAILTPVYIFMLLYYQPHLLSFVHKLFDAANDLKVSEVLAEIKTVVHGYLRGLFLEFIIISVLNSAGLLILGIDYAIIFGIAAAALNAIPLIGGVIGIGLFVGMALMSKPIIYVAYVIIVYSVIQFIDNHYIIPKIVGSKVKLNALVCVIAVIAGEALWGVPGMFLAIPLTAIVKLILDRIEPLQNWGFMLGDTVEEHPKPKFKFTIRGFISRIKS
jgi:predicted PurR-regulated permease PerM